MKIVALVLCFLLSACGAGQDLPADTPEPSGIIHTSQCNAPAPHCRPGN